MPIANIPIIYFIVIIGQMMGGGGYGNMANTGGMNQGMRGANQGGGMNQPWSGQMGNPQGAQMRQQPEEPASPAAEMARIQVSVESLSIQFSIRFHIIFISLKFTYH